MSDLINITFPLSDPVQRFFLILVIILLIPILADRLRIPHILGMILAGLIVGPYSLNLLDLDASIIISGTVGLLYIMFLAGLEIDMNDFRKNAGKSTVLGLYGFLVPMIAGTLAGFYLLKFTWETSILLASMFASHTLITYPTVSKLGLAKNEAVNISVGSTLITNILALLVLAVIVGLSTGEVNNIFWIRLSISFAIFTLIIVFIFPMISRWFFKRFHDNISQYIFVLVMVFLGAVLSKVAGIEPIIGAFMAGLALNRLIPRTSALMNRIDFVGNAIFIPFFLLKVGMLIDYRAFSDRDTIIVAITMSVLATLTKYLAARMTQAQFKYSKDQGLLIFGLTNAQAAATLAAVLVGYNIILGVDASGEPIRLLNDTVLNGTIIMILFTCTIASFATQKSGFRLSNTLEEAKAKKATNERILLPVNNPHNVVELINLSTIIKSKNNTDGLYAMNIINPNRSTPEAEKNARELLEKAAITASATDITLQTLLRYDANITDGIANIIRENEITDLVLGIHIKESFLDTHLGDITAGILSKTNVNTYIYRPFQPISTVKRHFVVVPEDAEYEHGFPFWLSKIWNIAGNTGNKILFYGANTTLEIIKDICKAHPIEVEFHEFTDWEDLLILSKYIRIDDNLIIVMSRKDQFSYKTAMTRVPRYLNKYFNEQSFLLIYPSNQPKGYREKVDLNNPSLLSAIEDIDIIGKSIAKIFKKR